jgi:hypothetical protein
MPTVGLRRGYVARTNNTDTNLTAPVCHVAPTADIPQPAGPTLPTVPVPVGATPAMQALINGYNGLAGFTPPRGGGVSGAGGLSGFKTKPQTPPKQEVGRFVEQSRETKKVHVTNPDDDQQFVDVEVITKLTMVDTKTGETWIWTR